MMTGRTTLRLLPAVVQLSEENATGDALHVQDQPTSIASHAVVTPFLSTAAAFATQTGRVSTATPGLAHAIATVLAVVWVRHTVISVSPTHTESKAHAHA